MIDGDAFVDQRFIDFDRRRKSLASLIVFHHHFAGEQFRHAGRIVFDDEFFELNREWQILNQYPILLRNNRGIAAGAFGNQCVAAKSWIAQPQAMLCRHLGDDAAAGEGRFTVEPLLKTDRQIGIEQAAEADNYNRAMGKNIAPLIRCPLLGSDQGRIVLLDDFNLVAVCDNAVSRLLRQRRTRYRSPPFRFVVEIAQRLLTHIVTPTAHVFQHLRRIAHDAQGRRQHQKTHD